MSSNYGVCKGLDGMHPIGAAPLVATKGCVCGAMQAMFCPFGHMLECHYPKTCEQANCDHYKRAIANEGGE